MANALAKIAKQGISKPKEWQRQEDGRYSFIGLPIAECHNYDGDVFSRARQADILAKTQDEEPEGGVWVGHPGMGDTEAPIDGTMVNYRNTSTGIGRHEADWVNLSPIRMQEIQRGKWRSYSVEYRLPNLDAYTGVALLGRSQAFFPFARISVKMSKSEVEQLNQDVEAWKAASATRSINKTKINPKGIRMKKKFRTVMGKDNNLRHEIAEMGDDDKWGKWRNVREGEEVEKDDEDLRSIRGAVEEFGQRIGNVEDRIGKLEDGQGGSDDGDDDDDKDRMEDGDDEDKKDDKDRKKPAGKRTQPTGESKAYRALKKRLDDSEAKATRTKFDAKIDTLVSAGSVIDAGTRSTIIDAVSGIDDEEKQDKMFDNLTKSIRKAPMEDAEDGQITKDADKDIDVLPEDEQKSVRKFFRKLGPNAKKAARAELKTFNKMYEEDETQHGMSGGATNWLTSNIRPDEHDA